MRRWPSGTRRLLALDHTQLRELLGDAELRELLDAEVVAELQEELQRLLPRQRLRDADGLHELLQYLGDLTPEELLLRCDAGAAASGTLETWLNS